MTTRKTLWIALALAGICNPSPSHAQTQLIPKIQEPLPVVDATDWWKKSWETGYQYEHQANFTLICETRVKAGERANWLQQTVLDHIKAGGYLNIEGRANATTVAIEGSPNPFLARYYDMVFSDRRLSGKLQTVSPLAQKIHQWIFAPGGIKEIVKGAVSFLTTASATVLSGVPPDPATGVAVGIAAGQIGKRAEDAFQEFLKSKGLRYQDDGFEVDPANMDSLPFGGELKNVDNFAVQMQAGFRNRLFFLQQSGKRLDVAQSEDADETQSVFAHLKTARKIAHGLPEPEAKVKAVLQRETLALNQRIFDGKQRKVGDVWAVDGAVFSGILHPDLTGAFRGKAVLTYDEDVDRQIVLQRVSGEKREKYRAKQLHLIPSGKTSNGDLAVTSLEYSESNFSAKVDDTTEAYVYVDTVTGMVREVSINFSANGSQNLPEMGLTQGLEAHGNTRLEIKYRASRTKLSNAVRELSPSPGATP